MKRKKQQDYLSPFSQVVVNLIGNIPPGKVGTYGQIAAAAGSPSAARQVARVLHSCSDKYRLPWHRVVGAGGFIMLKEEKGEIQKTLLREEGVCVDDNGKIKLEKYRFSAGNNTADR